MDVIVKISHSQFDNYNYLDFSIQSMVCFNYLNFHLNKTICRTYLINCTETRDLFISA